MYSRKKHSDFSLLKSKNMFLNPDPETDSRPGFRVGTHVQNSDPDPLAKQDPDTLTVYWFLSEDLDLPQDRRADPKPVLRFWYGIGSLDPYTYPDQDPDLDPSPDPGSGYCSFWPRLSRCQQKISFLSLTFEDFFAYCRHINTSLQRLHVIEKSQNSRNHNTRIPIS